MIPQERQCKERIGKRDQVAKCLWKCSSKLKRFFTSIVQVWWNWYYCFSKQINNLIIMLNIYQRVWWNWYHCFSKQSQYYVKHLPKIISFAFHLIFLLSRYILGVNQAATEIEMTRPVLTSVVATENNLVDQEMCFWLGTPWENKEVHTW